MDYGTLFQLAVSMYGEQKAQNMTDAQLRLLQDQVTAAQGTELPDLQNIHPEQMGESAAGAVSADPHLKQTEDEVLAELGNVYSSGGLDFRDKARITELLDESNQQANAGAGRIRQQLQGTGQLGSGADIAMQMGNAQGAANRAGSAAMSTAALAEQRKMDALGARGSMASSMRGEDYNERARSAAARDAREQWNAASREKAGYYNAGLPQQQFGNKMTKLGMSGQAGGNLANAYGAEAQGQRNFWSGMGASAKYGADSMGKGGGSGGGGGGSGGPVGYDNDGTPIYSNPDEWKNPYGGY